MAGEGFDILDMQQTEGEIKLADRSAEKNIKGGDFLKSPLSLFLPKNGRANMERSDPCVLCRAPGEFCMTRSQLVKGVRQNVRTLRCTILQICNTGTDTRA